jgi:parallel beta-helix repeat protein
VIDNAVLATSYHGIRALNDTLVEGNLVESSCLVLDDCGAIYAHTTGRGTLIRHNVVRNIPGGMEGKPAGTNSLAQGIFLDDEATDIVVLGNTVSNAENGIFLHNAHNNAIQANTLYGNRRNQIAMLEDRRRVSVYGDVFDNTVSDNLFFPTTPGAAIGHDTSIRETSRFGAYDRNRYSTLLARRVVSETAPGASVSLDFADWQNAAANGHVRDQEPNGAQVGAAGYAAFRVLGSTFMPNGTMQSGTAGWTPWSDDPPLATAWTSPCGATTCLEVAAGATASLVASPPFPVRAESWYRVTFDAKANVTAQALSVLVRRGGGGANGYESLMGDAEAVTVGTSLKRYTFAFKATKTINASDPVTGDVGARLYFDRIAPGSRISLANVEIVPLSAAETAMKSALFANPSAEAAYFSCPDATSNADLCSRYVAFPTGAALSWPVRIEPRSSLIGYTLDRTMIDSDGDGIMDGQDRCPGTRKGAAANAHGCAIGQ